MHQLDVLLCLHDSLLNTAHACNLQIRGNNTTKKDKTEVKLYYTIMGKIYRRFLIHSHVYGSLVIPNNCYPK